jgi:hypothetical protein
MLQLYMMLEFLLYRRFGVDAYVLEQRCFQIVLVLLMRKLFFRELCDMTVSFCELEIM